MVQKRKNNLDLSKIDAHSDKEKEKEKVNSYLAGTFYKFSVS